MKDQYEIIKKSIQHHQFEFKDGELLIWNIPAIILTMNNFVLLQHICGERFGKEFVDIIYYLAKQQARSGMEVLHRQFGFKNMKKVVDLEMQASGMVGMCVCKLKRFDVKNKTAIVKLDPNPVVRMHKKIIGMGKKAIDTYSRGGLAGIFAYAFDDPTVVGIETSCMAAGKKECIVKLKPRKMWDKKDPVVKEQMPGSEKKYKEIFSLMNAQKMKKNG